MSFDLEGARKAGFSDAEIAAHLAGKTGFRLDDARQAGFSDAEIVTHLMSKAETPDTPRSSFGRTLGLGARGVVEGVGDTFDFLAAPNPAFTLARSLKAFKPELAAKMLKPVGERTADALSLPTPETDGEKLGVAATRGAASVIPTLAVGGLPSVAKGAPTLAKFLTAAPLEQIAGSAAAGAASEAARQSGAGAWGQFGAGLAGGLAPSAAMLGGQAAGRVLRTTANMGDLFTKAGQKRAASRQLRRAIGAENVDGVLADIDAREMPVEGVEQSLAQITQNPRIAVMEKGLESSGPDGSKLIELYARQREARQNLAEELLEGMEARQELRADVDRQTTRGAYDLVEDTADSYWNDRSTMGIPEETGAKVKGVFGELYDKEKQAVREAYQDIDPEGTTSFNLEPLRDSLLEEIDPSPYAAELPAEIKKILANLNNDIQNGQTRTYNDLKGMRRALGDIITKAQASFDPNLARIAGGMKKRLDNYLMTAAEYADQPVTPKPGSAAYRDATKEALALSKARVAADSPMWDKVWGHLDADSLFRDFPDAKRELSQLHGRGLFARKGEGWPIDELADSLKTQGWLTPDADSSTLVEILKSKVRGKARAADELGNVLENMTQFGSGFTQEQARAFNRATAMRREQGLRFEQGANKALARTGETAMREASVMGNYFKQGAAGASAAQDFLRSVGNDPRALEAMHDYVLGLFLKESKDSGGKLSSSKMDAFLKRYDAALRQFPELEQNLTLLASQQAGADALKDSVEKAGKARSALGKSVLKRRGNGNAVLVGRKINDKYGKALVDAGLFSPVELELLKALSRSTEAAKRAVDLAKVHGSPTSQNLATQEFLANILGDNLDRQGGFLNALLTVPLNPVAAFLSRNFYGDASQAITSHLVDAAVNPEYAKELLTLGKDASNTTKALQKLFGFGPYRNLKSAGDILKNSAKAQANVNIRGLLDLLDEEEPKKKK